MTLPFENDTSRIVKKYAKHSISQSRVKTFLSVLTIVGSCLAVWLCFVCDWDGNRSKTRIACVKSDVISQSER